MDEGAVSFYSYFHRLLEDHEKLQNTQLASMDKALILAREEAQAQYKALNNLRADFIPKSEYRLAHEGLVGKFEILNDRITDTRNWFKVWGAVITALSLAFQLAAHLLFFK